MIVPPPRPRPADAAGGSAHPGPPLEPVAGSDLAAAPADAWSSLCEGVQQDMMLAMLGAFQGVAAACAEVCIQRMQLMHLELTRAVEHEVEEAEATARRDGHPSNAPILHSLADALGQKNTIGAALPPGTLHVGKTHERVPEQHNSGVDLQTLGWECLA